MSETPKTSGLRAQEFDCANIDNRLELIRFYDSKTTTHVGYLIADILAYISLQASLIGKLNDPSIMRFLTALFIASGSYFIGRAYYWTRRATVAFWIKTYTVQHQKDTYKNSKQKDIFEYNELFRLSDTIADYCLKIGEFEKDKNYKPNWIFIIFHSRWITGILLLLIGLISWGILNALNIL